MTQREKLILFLDKFDEECDGFFEYDTEPLADELIRNDIVPVVHGHWIDGGVWDVCSVCGRAFLKVHLNGNPTFNYCPNCGAKMDEVSE